ncbi:hypothetical protein OS493_011625 [Desmophyllum pertusum]|uniref:NACHT domain-containing protein n=1 Tax=Desmophyllum pertusum TaxID=174260 RepID=A0A9X0CL31_9CNID|nr:hypothetical protein OS493_011625 [Desmophyllum pertusum]
MAHLLANLNVTVVVTSPLLNKSRNAVTEDEIRRGIINASNPSKHCFWFKRAISDLHANIASKNAGKFIDKTLGANSSVDETAQKFLNVLREKDLSQVLPSTNIVNYDVKWSDNGVDPVKSAEHSHYIEKLCKDFYETLTQMIENGIQEKEKSGSRDAFAEEIFQHGSFCQKKCKSFNGRKEFLEASKNTLINHDKHGVVLYGESGCGKTSIMAKIAREVKQWIEDESPIVVLRFIGTSPDSSGIRPLLRSICTQLCKATGQSTADIPEDMKSLKDYFQECLEKSAENQPWFWFWIRWINFLLMTVAGKWTGIQDSYLATCTPSFPRYLARNTRHCQALELSCLRNVLWKYPRSLSMKQMSSLTTG